MKQQRSSDRKALMQAGGVLQKSSQMEAFSIVSRDDLQDYENSEKAEALLGFLVTSFEENSFEEANLEERRLIRKRLLRGG